LALVNSSGVLAAFLGCIAYPEYKHAAIVTDVPWSVCISVCLLDIFVSCPRMDELIEMPFGLWTHMHPVNHVLGYLDPLRGRGNFRASFTMQPFVKMLVRIL